MFTSVYSAIVAGALVFMSQIDYSQQINLGIALLLSIFLLAFSWLGFKVVISQSLGHLNYILNVLMILDRWNKTGFYKDPKKPFFLKRAYRNFYEYIIGFFAVLSLFYIFQIFNLTKQRRDILFSPLLMILFIAVPFIVFYFIENVLYRCKWKKYTEKRKLLIKALRKSKKRLFQPDWDEQFEDMESELWEKIKDEITSEELQSLEERLLRCEILSCIYTEINKRLSCIYTEINKRLSCIYTEISEILSCIYTEIRENETEQGGTKKSG